MIETIRSLSQLLMTESLTMDQTIASLGTVKEASYLNESVVVNHTSTAFRFARVQRDMESDAPYYVELALADGVTLTVADLQRAFGAPEPGVRMTTTSLEQPLSLKWYMPGSGRDYRCSMSAYLASGSTGKKTDRIIRVRLRRDAL